MHFAAGNPQAQAANDLLVADGDTQVFYSQFLHKRDPKYTRVRTICERRQGIFALALLPCFKRIGKGTPLLYPRCRRFCSLPEIGRASCRESVYILVGAGGL